MVQSLLRRFLRRWSRVTRPSVGSLVAVWSSTRRGQHGWLLEYGRAGWVRLAFCDVNGKPYSVWLRPKLMEEVTE